MPDECSRNCALAERTQVRPPVLQRLRGGHQLVSARERRAREGEGRKAYIGWGPFACRESRTAKN